jgi:hypothetical protein
MVRLEKEESGYKTVSGAIRRFQLPSTQDAQENQ